MYILNFIGKCYNYSPILQQYSPIMMLDDTEHTFHMLWMIDDVVLHIQRFVLIYLFMNHYFNSYNPTDVLDYIEIDPKDVEKELKKISYIIEEEPIDIKYFNSTDSIPFEDFAEYVVWKDWDPLNLDNLEEID